MRFFTYVVKSLNVLNMLLIAAVVFCAAYLLVPLMNKKATYRPPAVPQQAPAAQEQGSPANQSPPASDYIVVAEQNVFHPERKIPPEGKDDKPVPRPEIFLYGTILTDTVRLAYIEDKKSPQSTPGRGNRQVVVKQGDQVSGFLVKTVDKDKIVLVRGEEQIVVFLDDAKKTRTPVAPAQGTAAGAPRQTPTPAQQQPGLPAMLPGAGQVPPTQMTPQTGALAPGGAVSQSARQPSRPPRTNPAQVQAPAPR